MAVELPREALAAAVLALERCEGNQSAAARELGIHRHTFRNRLAGAQAQGINIIDALKILPGESEVSSIEFPTLPDEDIGTEDLLDMACRRYEQRTRRKDAERWMPIKVKSDLPLAINWFGDPHLDDNGCNLPLLRRHVELVEATEGMVAANVGDTTNNWTGRLMRLYADQDSSKDTARRFAKWFLTETKMEWILWLLGNHDAWQEGSAILKEMGGHPVWMQDWQARVVLKFPNGRECKIWASHQFAGHSIWNTLHGPQRAAHTKEDAHIYICGHTHNWATHHEESASRGFVYHLVRTRGYKYIDLYAENMGHESQNEGASVVTIIDPMAETEGSLVSAWPDPIFAARVLGGLRESRKAEGVK